MSRDCDVLGEGRVSHGVEGDIPDAVIIRITAVRGRARPGVMTAGLLTNYSIRLFHLNLHE